MRRKKQIEVIGIRDVKSCVLEIDVDDEGKVGQSGKTCRRGTFSRGC